MHSDRTTGSTSFLVENVPRFSPDLIDIGEYEGINEIEIINDQCNYYHKPLTVNDVTNISLNVMHLNARSIPKNFDRICSLVTHSKIGFDVIAISESWLAENSPAQYSLPGFNMINACPESYRGKGSALLIKNSIVYKQLPEFSVTFMPFQTLFIEIVMNSSANIILGTMYRSPSYDPREFLNYLESIVPKLLQTNKKLYSVGTITLTF